LTIRDQYHGLAFADDMDGPALYGYGGGKLRVAGNARGETPVDTLKWTRSGVDITGDTNISGKFAAGKFSVNNDDNGLTIKANAEAGKGRMHVTGEDELYVLNKKGMIVGKEWGGSGNVNIQGSIVAAGEPHDDWTGLNVKRRDGRWTHFDWKDDQKNYIRGDTDVDGHTNISGKFAAGESITAPRIKIIPDKNKWSWFEAEQPDGHLFFGGDPTNKGIWADGDRPFTIYRNGKAVTKFEAGGIDVQGNVGIPSGNALTIRDKFHGLSFADDMDGPALYGYGGGKLRVAGNLNGETPVDTLKWNRSGVDVTGYTNISGKFAAGESITAPRIKIIPDKDKWSWFEAEQPDGHLFFGGDPTNKGIWADGDRPFTIYRNGKAVTKFEAGGIDVTGNANISGKFAAAGGIDVTGNIKLTNKNSEICIGPRWCIATEGDDGQHLVFRDKLSEGDKRYAMYPNHYVDINNINNKIDNGQAITLKSGKLGKEERRLQRSEDENARFANNNRGDWEKLFIESL
jgi:filamentous hemagglutinin family protein